MKGKEATLCNEISQGTKKHQSVMGELKSIDSKLSSLEDDYARFQSELQSIAAKNKKILTITNEINNARNRITKLSSRCITLSSYVQKVNDLDFVLMSDDFFPDMVVALKNNVEKRKQQKGELAEVEGLISGQKDYQDVVRKLIIDVQNVNSVLKDGVCPVCGYDYKSQEELLQRIEANNILDDSIKILLDKSNVSLMKFKIYLEKFRIPKLSFLVLSPIKLKNVIGSSLSLKTLLLRKKELKDS